MYKYKRWSASKPSGFGLRQEYTINPRCRLYYWVDLKPLVLWCCASMVDMHDAAKMLMLAGRGLLIAHWKGGKGEAEAPIHIAHATFS